MCQVGGNDLTGRGMILHECGIICEANIVILHEREIMYHCIIEHLPGQEDYFQVREDNFHPIIVNLFVLIDFLPFNKEVFKINYWFWLFATVLEPILTGSLFALP
jgi:hypothetical protein